MKLSKTVVAVGATLALAACSDQSPVAGRAAVEAPLMSAAVNGIDGEYIVVLKDGANPRSVAAVAGVEPVFVYTAALNGFSASLNNGQLTALRHNPNVEYVEQQQLMSIETTQSGATWGLDRIDQRARPVDGSYTYDFDGAGVTAYVIDTGIRFDHEEFEGRAVPGFDAYLADPTDPLLIGDMNNDCQGHGTHVSGTIGGKTYGVAKKVKLVAVRVLNCAGYGSDADVIAGMDWVAGNATLPAVVNMSLGDVIPTKTMGTSTPVDDAVRGMIASGITMSPVVGRPSVNRNTASSVLSNSSDWRSAA